MNLDLLSLQNLSILAEIDNKNEFITVIDKIKLQLNKKEDTFNDIVDLSGLEYAIHFTFYHTITLFKIQKTNSKRKYIINKIDVALNNIWETYTDYINENERFKLILDHIDKVIDIIRMNYQDYYYFYKGIEYCNYLIDGFNHCKIVFTECNDEIRGFNKDIPYESSSEEEEGIDELIDKGCSQELIDELKDVFDDCDNDKDSNDSETKED